MAAAPDPNSTINLKLAPILPKKPHNEEKKMAPDQDIGGRINLQWCKKNDCMNFFESSIT